MNPTDPEQALARFREFMASFTADHGLDAYQYMMKAPPVEAPPPETPPYRLQQDLAAQGVEVSIQEIADWGLVDHLAVCHWLDHPGEPRPVVLQGKPRPFGHIPPKHPIAVTGFAKHYPDSEG